MFSRIVRRGIAEHVGHQAFNCTIPVGGVIGGAGAVLVVQGVLT